MTVESHLQINANTVFVILCVKEYSNTYHEVLKKPCFHNRRSLFGQTRFSRSSLLILLAKAFFRVVVVVVVEIVTEDGGRNCERQK